MTEGRKVVLAVDDSSEDLELIGAAFETGCRNCELRTVTAAADAKAYLEGRGIYADRAAYPLPDLLLLDIQMPQESGLEVLQWLRSRTDFHWHRVPVIMLTTSHDFAEIRKAYDMGANSFLVKPTGFDELLRLVSVLADYWLARNRYG